MALVVTPSAYLVAENGDAAKASERYEATLAWRKHMRLDSILAVPQIHYDVIKRCVSFQRIFCCPCN